MILQNCLEWLFNIKIFWFIHREDLVCKKNIIPVFKYHFVSYLYETFGKNNSNGFNAMNVDTLWPFSLPSIADHRLPDIVGDWFDREYRYWNLVCSRSRL